MPALRFHPVWFDTIEFHSGNADVGWQTLGSTWDERERARTRERADDIGLLADFDALMEDSDEQRLTENTACPSRS